MHEPTSSPGTIAAYALAWERGDVVGLLGAYADDIVAHYGGTSEFAGTHRGSQRFVEVLAETTARSHRRLVAVDAVYDHGDHGAIFVRESIGVGGREHEVTRALRYRVADGSIAECWLYDHDQHLVDLAWTAPSRSDPNTG